MTEALTAEPIGPQTDELVEQTDAPRPIEAKTSEEPPKSLDETLKAEVEKAVKGSEEKNDDKKPEKAEVKDADKADKKPEDANVDDKGTKKPDEIDDKPVEQAEPKTEPKPTAYKEPPNGFDDAAKKDWETVPESVRGAVHRRAQEMERGLSEYRKQAEEYEPLREYSEMAKKGGTDLPTALSKYVAMENELRRDPMSGLQAVVANLGLKKSDGSPVTLRDVAASIMGQTPDQAASRQEATISNLTQQVQTLTQQLGGFSKNVEQQQQQARVASVESEWTAFQSANPRAKELEPQIADFLTKYPADNMPVRERLQDAYDYASSKTPSVAHTDPQPLVQTQTPPTPNPAGQKSISGAGGESRTVRKTSSDDAIKKAIAKLNG